jgi:hypothetical protein
VKSFWQWLQDNAERCIIKKETAAAWAVDTHNGNRLVSENITWNGWINATKRFRS